MKQLVPAERLSGMKIPFSGQMGWLSLQCHDVQMEERVQLSTASAMYRLH